MPFTALIVELASGDAERLGDALLEAGAVSIDLEDARRGTAEETPVFDEPGEHGSWPYQQLTALFPGGSDAQRALREACAACGLTPPVHRLQTVPELDWVRQSQEQFQPIRISQRLWIVPSWHAAPDPQAINLALDPGLAFGTGSHPTTRLCLGWLEKQVRGGETVLDYGCGSGILAIAALKLGAGRAVGIDIEVEAIRAARANAERNGVLAEFADTTQPLTLSADLVVANILANPLKLLAPMLASFCRPGGRLALSGILAPQAGEVEEIYAPWFEFEPRVRDEDWVCVSGLRR